MIEVFANYEDLPKEDGCADVTMLRPHETIKIERGVLCEHEINRLLDRMEALA